MFGRKQVAWIVEDILRAELVKQRRDTFAFFDDSAAWDATSVSAPVISRAAQQVGQFFGVSLSENDDKAAWIEQATRAYQKNRAIYLSTSGSTGVPKLCLHTQAMMEIEARSVGSHLQQAKRLITLTPRQHLYGLSFAVFFPFVYHTVTLPLPPLPVQPWASLLRAGDVLAGFPLFWEYFLKAGNTFPPGVTAVTATAPCPKGLFARLRQAGAERVVELYGASETGGIGVRYNEEDPFQINDFWEVSLEKSVPLIRRQGPGGWVPFPDEVQFVPPRGIFPLKRTDAVVQVAGVNVSLKAVENVLRQHPAVKDCRVRLMRPEEGKRLKAFIVPHRKDAEKDLPDIRCYLTKHLSSHELPRSFTFGEQLPLNTLGKDSDW